MRSKKLRFLPLLLAFLILLSAIPVLGADPVFNITEEILPLKNGTSYQLYVKYFKSDAIDHLTWYSSDSSIATVSQDGRITAKKNGQVIIYAEYDKDNTVTDYCTVNVLTSVYQSWGLIDGAWFLFNGTNYMTGWQYVGGKWYYMDSTGAMLTGWQKVNGTWYYMSDSGAMLTGWQFINGYWYFLYDSGAMATGWLKRGNTWYLLADSGAMLTGWQIVNGTWYYMSDSGAMLTGWQFINNRWYYMNASGAMLTGWQYIGGSWYLLADSGAMLTGWQNLSGAWYYLMDSGRMATETVTIDGYQQVFHTSGAWIYTGAMDSYAAGLTSETNYLILVSLSDKVTKIYKKNGNAWAVEKAFLCTVGDSANGMGTITGDFYIGQSSWGNPTWKGYSFDDSEGHTLYYWTRFCDAYLFHSILYDSGTWNESVSGNGLGKELSHGCVRLRWYNAEWIYDNIPYGTRVIVY